MLGTAKTTGGLLGGEFGGTVDDEELMESVVDDEEAMKTEKTLVYMGFDNIKTQENI